MSKINLPNIPAITEHVSKNSKPALDALKEIVETGQGKRDPYNRYITLQELVDGNIAVVQGGGGPGRNGSYTPVVPPSPSTNSTIPPAITGLTASGALTHIILSWTDTGFSLRAFTEIWRSTSNDLGTAVMVGTSQSSVFADGNVTVGATYYYWVRDVSTSNINGPFNAVAGVSGSTAPDIPYIIGMLNGQISSSELAAALSSRIDLIDAPTTGLVDQNAANASALVAQANDIANNAAGILSNQAAITSLSVSSSAGANIDPEPNSLWEFENSLDGWTAFNATLATNTYYMRATGSAADPQIVSPSGLTVNGGLYPQVVVRARRISGTGWDGACYFTTAGHGFNGSYRKDISKPANFDAGGWEILSFDMESLTVGGNDWMSNTITGLRLDIGVDALDVIEIDWVAIARYSPPASSAALNALDVRVTNNAAGVSANAVEVTTLKSTVNDPTTGVAANASAIGVLDTAVTSANGNISVNSSDISSLKATVDDPTTGVNANASGLTALNVVVATNQSGISANASEITSLKSTVNDPTTGVNANASGLTALNAVVVTNQSGISANASEITSLKSTVNDPTTGVAANASAIGVLDTAVTSANGNISVNSSDISLLKATVDDPTTGVNANAAAATSLDARVTSNEGVLTSHASSITTLNSSVGSNSTSISTNLSSINGIQGKYTVKIDNNGYIAGYGLISTNNNGTPTSAFIAKVGTFAIGDVGVTTNYPFIVNGGVVYMKNAMIQDAAIVNAKIGNLAVDNAKIASLDAAKINTGYLASARIAANTITAQQITVNSLGAISAALGTISSGNITLNTGSWIKGGQSAYNTGTGFFLGYDGAAYKFSIGNATTNNSLTWDGSTLRIRGDLALKNYSVSGGASKLIISNDGTKTVTIPEGSTSTTFARMVSFVMQRAGVVRVSFTKQMSSGQIGTFQTKVQVNGVDVAGTTHDISTPNIPTVVTHDITLSDPDDEISIQGRFHSVSFDGYAPYSIYGYIDNSRIYNDFNLVEYSY